MGRPQFLPSKDPRSLAPGPETGVRGRDSSCVGDFLKLFQVGFLEQKPLAVTKCPRECPIPYITLR